MKRSGWTDKQKRLAIIACRDARISNDRRKLILRQLGGHAIPSRGGEPTSTSPRLTDADFEKFMSCAEMSTPDNQLLSFAPFYWQDKYIDGPFGRLKHRAVKLSLALTDAGVEWIGIVTKAIGRDFDNHLANLDQDELNKAIDAMTAVGKRPAPGSGKGAA
jgi:hypothetical protein